ncbi:phosphoadenosine phosphosulfate reductase family protein [Rhodococcus wratislaviensis]|uniref:phosphoadenosine phosphosulfate reductase domain-containing protein n=1 Tax=Rhodococcus wratislaviensis TaxID=44752 RepID=UPI001CED0C70|nr:phosphoadenosine phosphosulfate reductase family protein [Rhodococcus wratislaviensis]
MAFSGGKASLVGLDLTRRVIPNFPVVFFDAGLDYRETYDYLTRLADQWELDLHRIPTDPLLLQVLTNSGLWDHAASSNAAAARVNLHQVLITEPARRAHALLGPGACGVCEPTSPPHAAFSSPERPLRRYHHPCRRNSRLRADLELDHRRRLGVVHHAEPTSSQSGSRQTAPARSSRTAAPDLPPHRRQPDRPRRPDVATPQVAKALRGASRQSASDTPDGMTTRRSPLSVVRHWGPASAVW